LFAAAQLTTQLQRDPGSQLQAESSFGTVAFMALRGIPAMCTEQWRAHMLIEIDTTVPDEHPALGTMEGGVAVEANLSAVEYSGER
jgi:hypothetical protein